MVLRRRIRKIWKKQTLEVSNGIASEFLTLIVVLKKKQTQGTSGACAASQNTQNVEVDADSGKKSKA